MVNLHFLSLMEALQECNSSVLAKVGNNFYHSYHYLLHVKLTDSSNQCATYVSYYTPSQLILDLQHLQTLNFNLLSAIQNT